MKVPSPKNQKTTFLTGVILSVALMGMSTLPAHAVSNADDVVTVTMKMPEINSADDYNAALKQFRSKASDACEVKGAKHLQARVYERACVEELVGNFEQQINARFENATYAKKEKLLG